MTGSLKRSILVATAAAGLCTVTGGIAQAAPNIRVYKTGLAGPFSTEAICNATSTARNDPPDVYTNPCYYFAGDQTDAAGWYYLYRWWDERWPVAAGPAGR